MQRHHVQPGLRSTVSILSHGQNPRRCTSSSQLFVPLLSHTDALIRMEPRAYRVHQGRRATQHTMSAFRARRISLVTARVYVHSARPVSNQTRCVVSTSPSHITRYTLRDDVGTERVRCVHGRELQHSKCNKRAMYSLLGRSRRGGLTQRVHTVSARLRVAGTVAHLSIAKSSFIALEWHELYRVQSGLPLEYYMLIALPPWILLQWVCPINHTLLLLTRPRTCRSSYCTSCVKCGPGTFAQAPGSTQCLPCAPGSATNQNGTSKCTQCSPGQVQPVSRSYYLHYDW